MYHLRSSFEPFMTHVYDSELSHRRKIHLRCGLAVSLSGGPSHSLTQGACSKAPMPHHGTKSRWPWLHRPPDLSGPSGTFVSLGPAGPPGGSTVSSNPSTSRLAALKRCLLKFSSSLRISTDEVPEDSKNTLSKPF